MPEEYTVGMQRSFRGARRSGGIADEGGIISAGYDRFEGGGAFFYQIVKPEDPVSLFSPCQYNHLKVGQPVPDFQDLVEIGLVRDNPLRLAVGQAVFQCFRSKESKQRYGNGAHFIQGDMRDARFRRLGKHDPEPVSTSQALRLKPVGQTV